MILCLCEEGAPVERVAAHFVGWLHGPQGAAPGTGRQGQASEQAEARGGGGGEGGGVQQRKDRENEREREEGIEVGGGGRRRGHNDAKDAGEEGGNEASLARSSLSLSLSVWVWKAGGCVRPQALLRASGCSGPACAHGSRILGHSLISFIHSSKSWTCACIHDPSDDDPIASNFFPVYSFQCSLVLLLLALLLYLRNVRPELVLSFLPSSSLELLFLLIFGLRSFRSSVSFLPLLCRQNQTRGLSYPPTHQARISPPPHFLMALLGFLSGVALLAIR